MGESARRWFLAAAPSSCAHDTASAHGSAGSPSAVLSVAAKSGARLRSRASCPHGRGMPVMRLPILRADPWFAVREVVYRRNRSRRAIVAGRGIARKCPSATVGNGTSRPHAAQQNGSSEGVRASARPAKTAASAHISPKCEPGSRPRALAARCRPRGEPAAGSALPRARLRIRSLQPKCSTPRRRKPKPERPLAFDRALELIRLAEKYKFAAGMAAQTYTNPALVSGAATPAASYS